MPADGLSTTPETRDGSPVFPAIRRSVRSDGFKRMQAPRVLPSMLIRRTSEYLHTDPIGTPRLVIRDRGGWVVVGRHAGVLHWIPAPDSSVPAGAVF